MKEVSADDMVAIHNYLSGIQDEGPENFGWQSDELKALIQRLNTPSTPPRSEAAEFFKSQHDEYIDRFIGEFYIRFVGERGEEWVAIKDVRVDGNNRPLILIGGDGKVYNYSNVISMRKVVV